MLSQILEDGTEHPVRFASRTVNAVKRNYSQLNNEGAVIMSALKKIHKQLNGCCFVITTDHKPLVSLFGDLKQVPIMALPDRSQYGLSQEVGTACDCERGT